MQREIYRTQKLPSWLIAWLVGENLIRNGKNLEWPHTKAAYERVEQQQQQPPPLVVGTGFAYLTLATNLNLEVERERERDRANTLVCGLAHLFK